MTAPDRPSVTDNARAEAERRYPGWVNGTVPFWDGLEEARELAREYFIEGAEWAAGRAEAIEAKALELHAEHCPIKDCTLGATARWLHWAEEVLHGEAAGRAETTTATATAEDAAKVLLAHFWDASDEQLCTCGESPEDYDGDEDDDETWLMWANWHGTHVAQALHAHGLLARPTPSPDDMSDLRTTIAQTVGHDTLCHSARKDGLCCDSQIRRDDVLSIVRQAPIEAWDEAALEAYDRGWLHDHALDDLLARNPYRKTP